MLVSTVFVHGINVALISLNQTLKPVAQLYVTVQTSSAGAGYVDLGGLDFQLKEREEGSTNNDNVVNKPNFTFIDIVLVPMPDDYCEVTQVGTACNWPLMGIGRKRDPNSTADWYCCTSQAQESGICKHKERGRLLFTQESFIGQSLNVSVPTSEEVATGTKLQLPLDFTFDLVDPGNYSLLMANCDVDFGRPVLVSGKTEWISFEADLEKFVSENVPFYSIMTFLYAILWGWYGLLMVQNRESRIKLEGWILVVIVLGFGDVLFRLFQYAADEQNQNLSKGFLTVGAILGSIKHSMGRCLLLMLSLGWGVVHPSLDPIKRACILTLTTTFCILRALSDILLAYGYDDDDDNESDQDSIVGSVIALCIWLSIAIDLIFFLWIPAALLQTMKHLKSTNQKRKLERYRSLLRILGFVVFFTIALVVIILLDFAYNDSKDINILNITQANEVNFFLTLTFVAVVWRPNPMAREFAYVVELTGDEDGIMADLELSENPSSASNGARGNVSDTTGEDSASYSHFPPVEAGEST